MTHRFSARGPMASAVLAAALTAGALGESCIPQDFNRDGAVDGDDLGTLLGFWGPDRNGNPADFNGDGQVDGDDLGTLLGVWGPVPPISCVEVTGIRPTTGLPGDLLTLTGSFPDPDREDYCSVAMDGDGNVIPFEVVGASATELTLRVGPSAPGTGTGSVMVGLGAGTVGGVRAPEGAGLSTSTWSWSADGPGAMFEVTFTPASTAGPVGGSYTSTLSGGSLSVVITGDCPPGTAFEIWPRAHHYATGPDDPYIGYDAHIPCVSTLAGGDSEACANFICGVVTAVYAAHQPDPIAVTCSVTPVSGGAMLTLSLPGVDIDWGIFNITVLPGGTTCGISSTCETCPCDFNGDGVTDGEDLGLLLGLVGNGCDAGGWSTCCPDLNKDGIIDVEDSFLFPSCKGDCPIPPP